MRYMHYVLSYSSSYDIWRFELQYFVIVRSSSHLDIEKQHRPKQLHSHRMCHVPIQILLVIQKMANWILERQYRQTVLLYWNTKQAVYGLKIRIALHWTGYWTLRRKTENVDKGHCHLSCFRLIYPSLKWWQQDLGLLSGKCVIYLMKKVWVIGKLLTMSAKRLPAIYCSKRSIQ